MTKHKSHYEHLMEEKDMAMSEKAKLTERDKARIYLKDAFHTILLVNKSKLSQKVDALKRRGEIILRIL